jgi:hypothetical protein
MVYLTTHRQQLASQRLHTSTPTDLAPRSQTARQQTADERWDELGSGRIETLLHLSGGAEDTHGKSQHR